MNRYRIRLSPGVEPPCYMGTVIALFGEDNAGVIVAAADQWTALAIWRADNRPPEELRNAMLDVELVPEPDTIALCAGAAYVDPAEPERQAPAGARLRLRDLVPFEGRKLAARAARFMYKSTFTRAPMKLEPDGLPAAPRYRDWLRLACRPRAVRWNDGDRPKLPEVPAGLDEAEQNALTRNPYFLAEFDRLNNLKG